jgi:hypothetical protein
LKLRDESRASGKWRMHRKFPRLAGCLVSAAFGLAVAKYWPSHHHFIKSGTPGLISLIGC